MKRFLFVLITLMFGAFGQIVCASYLSVGQTAPQLLLLLAVATGFVYGPLMGEVLGFAWGIMSDAAGVSLFGMNGFLLLLAGFAAGMLRKRVASERVTAQLVIGAVSTVFYALGASVLYSMFEGTHRLSFGAFLLHVMFNVLLVSFVFVGVERWVSWWGLQNEHV